MDTSSEGSTADARSHGCRANSRAYSFGPTPLVESQQHCACRDRRQLRVKWSALLHRRISQSPFTNYFEGKGATMKRGARKSGMDACL